MNENIYIEIIKFGREKLSDDLPYVDMIDAIQRISKKDKKFAETVFRMFFTDEGRLVYLKSDALYNLIQYERIEETRKESKISFRFAIAAIMLNILTLIISIVLLLKD